MPKFDFLVLHRAQRTYCIHYQIVVSTKMRSINQLRGFSKVFGLVKKSGQAVEVKKVRIVRATVGANSQTLLLNQISGFKQSLDLEKDITNKIKLIYQLTIQLKVLDTDILQEEVTQLLDQNEDQVYNFLLHKEVSVETQMLVISSLYFDPRFVSRKLNDSRLSNLLSIQLAKLVSDKQDQVLGLTEDRQNPKNATKRPLTDNLLQTLIETGLAENQKIAQQIANNHLESIKTFSIDELITRIQRVLGYLIFEHKKLQKQFRYSSDKIQPDQDSLLVRVIDELEKRIEQGQLTKERFLKLLFLGSEGHRREALYFRLFRHFSPVVLKFVNQNFIDPGSSPIDLWRVAYSYAMDNHEQDMRIVYSDFLHKIIDRLAQDEVLYDQSIINLESLRNVVRSMGSLLISSDSCVKILRHYNDTNLKELDGLTHPRRSNLVLFDQLSIFIQTAVNLRCFDEFNLSTEILPQLDYFSKINYTSSIKNDPKAMYSYLSILKGLAKAGLYSYQEEPIPLWNMFLEGSISPIVMSDLKCLGQYAYVAQLVEVDLGVKVQMLDQNDLKTLRKLKTNLLDNNYNLHNQVKRLLSNIGVDYKQEVSVGVLNVDFVLPKHKIAIELDGPSHFLIRREGQLKLSGTTLAKQRCLVNCGEFDHVFQAVGNLAQAEVKSVEDVMEEVQALINK